MEYIILILLISCGYYYLTVIHPLLKKVDDFQKRNEQLTSKANEQQKTKEELDTYSEELKSDILRHNEEVKQFKKELNEVEQYINKEVSIRVEKQFSDRKVEIGRLEDRLCELREISSPLEKKLLEFKHLKAELKQSEADMSHQLADVKMTLANIMLSQSQSDRTNQTLMKVSAMLKEATDKPRIHINNMNNITGDVRNSIISEKGGTVNKNRSIDNTTSTSTVEYKTLNDNRRFFQSKNYSSDNRALTFHQHGNMKSLELLEK